MLKNLKLRTVVILMISASLLSTLVFAYWSIGSDLEKSQETTILAERIAVVDEITTILPLLQKERGASAVYLTSGGTSFQDQMTARRAETDRALPDILAALARQKTMYDTQRIIENAESTERLFQQLTRMRGLIDSLALEPKDQLAFYTQITESIGLMGNLISPTVQDPRTLLALQAMSGLELAIDQAGLERALGASAIESGLNQENLGRLLGMAGAQSAALNFASRIMSNAERETLKVARYQGVGLEFLEMRERLEIGADANTSDLTPQAWFDLASRRMVQLNQIEAAVKKRIFQQVDALGEQAKQQLWASLILLVAMVGSGLVLTAVLYRSMMSRFGSVAAALRDLTEGNLETQVPEITTNEFGEIAKAIGIFKDEALRREELESETRSKDAAQQHVVAALNDALRDVSEGRMTTQVTTAFAPEYEQLRENFNHSIHHLYQSLLLVGESADHIRHRAHEMTSAANGLSKRTDEQAAALAQTAVALNQITSQIKTSAQAATQTQEVTQRARKQAEESGLVVKRAVDAIDDVKSRSSEISKIVDLIDDLSFQTNLLALNAGVEAARAGEAGRGFAVVASEVRALAQRSAKSAAEIRGLIQSSTDGVDNSVALVTETGEALAGIISVIAEVSDQMSQISSSANDQAASLVEINGGLAQVDDVTRSNVTMVSETTRNAQDVVGQTAELQRVLSAFVSETIPQIPSEPELRAEAS